MFPRLFLIMLAFATLGCGEPAAQTRVRTETITPPSAMPPPAGPTETGPRAPPPAPESPASPQAKPETPAAVVQAPPSQRATIATPETSPEIISDLSRLPPPVARMRARILEAARSGDLEKVVTVMQSNETMPVFSLGAARNPTTYWKTSYPDSDGIEILAILITVLESPFVHVDWGTPQEMYVWPYFARTPLKELTPAQKVELFRIVTGLDFKEMKAAGAYTFYRLGIGPDGTWHFFVAGD
jgi:hypothetical protein